MPHPRIEELTEWADQAKSMDLRTAASDAAADPSPAELDALELASLQAQYEAKRKALNAKPNIVSQISLCDFIVNEPKVGRHY